MTDIASLLTTEQEWLGPGAPGSPSPRGCTPIPAVLLLVVCNCGQSTPTALGPRGGKNRAFRIHRSAGEGSAPAPCRFGGWYPAVGSVREGMWSGLKSSL